MDYLAATPPYRLMPFLRDTFSAEGTTTAGVIRALERTAQRALDAQVAKSPTETNQARALSAYDVYQALWDIRGEDARRCISSILRPGDGRARSAVATQLWLALRIWVWQRVCTAAAARLPPLPSVSLPSSSSSIRLSIVHLVDVAAGETAKLRMKAQRGAFIFTSRMPDGVDVSVVTDVVLDMFNALTSDAPPQDQDAVASLALATELRVGAGGGAFSTALLNDMCTNRLWPILSLITVDLLLSPKSHRTLVFSEMFEAVLRPETPLGDFVVLERDKVELAKRL